MASSSPLAGAGDASAACLARVLLRWAASKGLDTGEHADDLRILSDGHWLLSLVSTTLGVPEPEEAVARHSDQARVLALETAKNAGVNVSSIDADLLSVADSASILSLAWNVFACADLSGLDGASAVRARMRSDVHEAASSSIPESSTAPPAVDAASALSNLHNGVALCLLVAAKAPDSLDVESLNPDNSVYNAAMALRLAASLYQVPRLLEPRDIADGLVCPRALLVWLAAWYQAADTVLDVASVAIASIDGGNDHASVGVSEAAGSDQFFDAQSSSVVGGNSDDNGNGDGDGDGGDGNVDNDGGDDDDDDRQVVQRVREAGARAEQEAARRSAAEAAKVVAQRQAIEWQRRARAAELRVRQLQSQLDDARSVMRGNDVAQVVQRLQQQHDDDETLVTALDEQVRLLMAEKESLRQQFAAQAVEVATLQTEVARITDAAREAAHRRDQAVEEEERMRQRLVGILDVEARQADAETDVQQLRHEVAARRNSRDLLHQQLHWYRTQLQERNQVLNSTQQGQGDAALRAWTTEQALAKEQARNKELAERAGSSEAELTETKRKLRVLRQLYEATVDAAVTSSRKDGDGSERRRSSSAWQVIRAAVRGTGQAGERVVWRSGG